MRMNFSNGIAHKTGLCAAAIVVLGATALATSTPAEAQYRQTVRNDLSKCHAGAGPAVMITVDGVRTSTGNIRVQSYNATPDEWLKKGQWLNRIEVPARQGTMTFCLPVPRAGSFGIAVRHDVEGNGKTDLSTDGGGMSNNPSINIFNLGRPSIRRTAIDVDNGVKSIRILMRYR